MLQANITIMAIANIMLSHIGCGSHENTASPLFIWIPIISLLISFILTVINLGLYKTNKKAFMLLYSKPMPEIIKIDTRPTTENGRGGFVSICSMVIRVYNPSSFGNHIKIGFRQKKKTLTIIDRVFQDKIPSKETTYYAIAPFGKSDISLNLHYEEAKGYIDQAITLVITDIKNNESILDFIFKDQKRDNPPAFLKA
jgi:hypothetical protein